MPKTCSYTFKTGPDANKRCPRRVHTNGLCCGHHTRKSAGGNMDELSGKPVRCRKRTSSERGSLERRLDNVAAVLRVSRTELLRRIAEEWLNNLAS